MQALDGSLKAEILERAVPRRLDRDEILFLAGDDAGRVHVLLQGLMKLSACDDAGRETILGLAVPDDLIGDMAALDELGQPYDAIAITNCVALGIDAAHFVDVVRRSGPASFAWARTIAARNRWLAAAARERGSSVVTARLAGRLLDLAELAGRMRSGTIEIDLPLAQSDLGKLAGMSRESACRGLRKLQRDGVLTYERKKLRIFRPDALERIRCAGRAAAPCR
jgi:CRP-like cAMP-binding protein